MKYLSLIIAVLALSGCETSSHEGKGIEIINVTDAKPCTTRDKETAERLKKGSAVKPKKNPRDDSIRSSGPQAPSGPGHSTEIIENFRARVIGSPVPKDPNAYRHPPVRRRSDESE